MDASEIQQRWFCPSSDYILVILKWYLQIALELPHPCNLHLTVGADGKIRWNLQILRSFSDLRKVFLWRGEKAPCHKDLLFFLSSIFQMVTLILVSAWAKILLEQKGPAFSYLNNELLPCYELIKTSFDSVSLDTPQSCYCLTWKMKKQLKQDLSDSIKEAKTSQPDTIFILNMLKSNL